MSVIDDLVSSAYDIVLRATPWEAGDDIVAVRGAHDEHEHEHEDDDPLQHELKRD